MCSRFILIWHAPSIEINECIRRSIAYVIYCKLHVLLPALVDYKMFPIGNTREKRSVLGTCCRWHIGYDPVFILDYGSSEWLDVTSLPGRHVATRNALIILEDTRVLCGIRSSMGKRCRTSPCRGKVPCRQAKVYWDKFGMPGTAVKCASCRVLKH